ncbi:sugar kinase [Microbacterium sp. PRC9]|uniref:sugar kinase n=1 Tax=Microbacterium sp. PRC9 TaxID=2962591 RepID=UPI002881A74E|nr:sugar kinase [Microbacterium sp. PRC9]MDT0141379.1 sugar kinase [Microbacterium sp. PRC9]
MADARDPRVVTLGETMALMRATEIGSLRHVPAVALGIGGAESNVAIGLRRLGVDSSWLGRVGDDSLGERVAREIRAEGVDVRAVVDRGAPTGLMVKERPDAASTAVFYYRAGSAGSRVAPGDVPAGWIEEADLLHVSGITALISESGRATLHTAIDRARAAGVRVSFDVNYRSALADPDAAGPMLRALAERADVVFGGAEELVLMFPEDDPHAAARRLLDTGCSQVVLKLGADGATVFQPGTVVEGRGFRIDAVDTVGAGDAFVAGYLSGMLAGLEVADALGRANTCGAMACLTPGDWEAGPSLRDVEAFQRGDADPVRR